MSRQRWYSYLLYAILLAIAVLVCCPVIFLISSSFQDPAEIKNTLAPILDEADGYASVHVLPLLPTLQHYIKVLLDTPEFFVMFWNSVKMTGGILLGHMVFGVTAAWGFAQFEFKGKKWLFFLYVALMLLPFQVLMTSEYLVFSQLNLMNTVWSIILPGAFSTFPVFIMYHFFCGIPRALLESARLDGAGEWQIFFTVGIPLGYPGIISAVVLGFLENWNLIEQPLAFLQDKSQWPLSLFLPQITTQTAGLAFAVSVFTLIPCILVFLFGQDYLEQGIMAIAIKE